MTPDQRIMAKWILILLFLIGVFFSGFGVRGYMANHEQTLVKLEHQKAANATLNQYAEDLKGLASRNQELRDTVADLDTKHTQVMNEKLAENSALRRDLDVAQRMRLKGSTCPQAGTSSDVAGGTGLGDDSGIELSPATRLAVWDLRESIIQDQAKLTYLQEERRTLTCSPQKSPE